ncbi:MAG: hypothetical protein WKG07_31980 [Hymenobacter sp.]
MLLIAPNTTKPGKFYIDDWTGLRLTNFVATATRATSAAALASVYPNPSRRHGPPALQPAKASVVSLAVYDALGRRAAAVLKPAPAGRRAPRRLQHGRPRARPLHLPPGGGWGRAGAAS